MDFSNMHLFSEPYKISAVENIEFKSHEERLEALKSVHFNPFRISHEDVIIDLLTDSGTNSVSAVQQSKAYLGDESYAGATSFKILADNIKSLTGFQNVLPVHQKRLSEQIVCEVLAKPGGNVVGNTFTHSMETNIRARNAIPVGFVTEDNTTVLGGNLDMEKFRSFVAETGTESINFVVLNAPSKILGGMPVSLANIKEVTSFCKRHSILVILETSMYAENSWFVKSYENGQSDRELREIAREMFSYFDGCIISFTRDGSSSNGSVIACREKSFTSKFMPLLILKGGFVSYGGISGRSLETITPGISESFNEEFIEFRFKQMHSIGELLKENGVPIIEPIGTNTIFIDVDRIQKGNSDISYPAWSLNCAAYVHGGVRGAEYGRLTGPGSSLPDNHPLANKELIKLEIPRRTYTLCHYLYVARVFSKLIANPHMISGMRLLNSPVGPLKHMKIKLEPLAPEKLNKLTSSKSHGQCSF